MDEDGGCFQAMTPDGPWRGWQNRIESKGNKRPGIKRLEEVFCMGICKEQVRDSKEIAGKDVLKKKKKQVQFMRCPLTDGGISALLYMYITPVKELYI